MADEEKKIVVDLRVVKNIRDRKNVAIALRQIAEVLEGRKMTVEPPVTPQNPLDSGKRSVDSIMQYGENLGFRHARDMLLTIAEMLETKKE